MKALILLIILQHTSRHKRFLQKIYKDLYLKHPPLHIFTALHYVYSIIPIAINREPVAEGMSRTCIS